MTDDCLNIVVVGVGGQGIILVSRIVGEASLNSNLNVMVSEIHGMAQRGGKVISTIRIGDAHSPMIGSGEADIILGLEPIETYRYLGFASEKTTIITSTNQVFPFTVTAGKEEYPDLNELFADIKKVGKKFVKLDIEKITKKNGLPVIVGNMIMLGALSGACPEVPISPEKFKETIKQNVPLRFAEVNLKAFDIGFKEANTN